MGACVFVCWCMRWMDGMGGAVCVFELVGWEGGGRIVFPSVGKRSVNNKHSHTHKHSIQIQLVKTYLRAPQGVAADQDVLGLHAPRLLSRFRVV